METARKTDFSAIFHAPNMWKYLKRIEFLARALAIPKRLRILTDEKKLCFISGIPDISFILLIRFYFVCVFFFSNWLSFSKCSV